MGHDRLHTELHLDILLSYANRGDSSFDLAVERLLEAYPETDNDSILRDALATGLRLLGDEVTVTFVKTLVFDFHDRLTELRNGLR